MSDYNINDSIYWSQSMFEENIIDKILVTVVV